MPSMLKVAQANLNMDPFYEPDADMTVKQAAQLRDLCEKLDEEFDGNLTQQQAANRIIALEDQLDS